MSETIRMPGPEEDKGAIDVTSKPPSSVKPPSSPSTPSTPSAAPSTPPGGLEQTIKSDSSQQPKSDSKTAGGTLKKGGSTTNKSRLDDIPADALAFVDDPTKQLGSYILVKLIGKGGMGAVWKAWDRKLTRWVAIKFLLVSDEDDVMRFQREAKLAARLRHPNIAPIYEVGEAPATHAGDQTRHYLAMEYIDGQTMSSATNLPIPEILDLFMKVAQGIEAAHKAGVVHRDLKPANIMLTTDKWPYVMDFGLAKAIQGESSLSVSGAVMGTPAYMPPEQAQGQLDKIDAQSDVYSLGATMYAVLCKKQPFTGQTPMEILMKVCKDEPPSLKSHNPEIPDEVEKIVLKAMAKEKTDRYASSLALAEDLKRYLTNQEIEAKGPSSLKMAAKRVKRNVWPLVVTAIVLVAAGAIGFLALRKPEPPVVIKDPTPPVHNPVVNLPPPDDTAGKKAAEWYTGWLKLTELMDFDDWKAGDATLAERVNKHLASLKASAPLREGDIYDWFDRQVGRAETQMSRLGAGDERRATAARVTAWCDVIQAAAKGQDYIKKHAESAAKVRASAARIADYKGTFVLRLLVGPFAEVTKLTRNGKDVPLPQRSTPLLLSGLEIGDYEVEFTHPQLGKKTEKISEKQLKDGKAYQISGRLQDAKLRVTELP